MPGDPTRHIVVFPVSESDQLGAWPAGRSAIAILKACSLKAKCKAGTLQHADGTGNPGGLDVAEDENNLPAGAYFYTPAEGAGVYSTFACGLDKTSRLSCLVASCHRMLCLMIGPIQCNMLLLSRFDIGLTSLSGLHLACNQEVLQILCWRLLCSLFVYNAHCQQRLLLLWQSECLGQQITLV